MAKNLLADPKVKAKLEMVQINFFKDIGWLPDIFLSAHDEENLSELIWQIAQKKPEKFFAAAALQVHNALDGHHEGIPPLEMKNKRGDVMTLVGDGHMNEAQGAKAMEVAKAAVAESVKNLEQVAAGTAKPDDASLLTRVWDYTPVPTEASAAKIEEIIKKALDFEDPEVVKVYTDFGRDYIDQFISTIKDMGYMRDRPKVKAYEPDPRRPHPGKI